MSNETNSPSVWLSESRHIEASFAWHILISASSLCVCPDRPDTCQFQICTGGYARDKKKAVIFLHPPMSGQPRSRFLHCSVVRTFSQRGLVAAGETKRMETKKKNGTR